jgi:excisionase family DNA binding protein
MMQEQTAVAPPLRLLLTMEEAAQALSLSVRYVYNLFYTHQIPTVKIGRSRRVSVAALQAFIERQAELG